MGSGDKAKYGDGANNQTLKTEELLGHGDLT
jgi:hypothetical protein